MFGIADRGHITLRLVKDDVGEPLRRMQELAIDPNVILFGISLAPKLSNWLTVDEHASGGNQFFRLAARGDSGCGNDLL